jgi:hypothetical protein
MATVDARSRDRLRFLENTITRRKEGEIDDLFTVLDELEKAIRGELGKGFITQQLSLPGLDLSELNQMRVDISALEARLERIPEERKHEKETIEKRYANPVDRTFPVAVVFLVPQSLIERGE